MLLLWCHSVHRLAQHWAMHWRGAQLITYFSGLLSAENHAFGAPLLYTRCICQIRSACSACSDPVDRQPQCLGSDKSRHCRVFAHCLELGFSPMRLYCCWV